MTSDRGDEVRRWLNRSTLLCAALAALAVAHFSGQRAEAAKSLVTDPDELEYLPEGRVLRIASLGHTNLLADLVWLRAIQYYGEQRLTSRNYDQAERLFTAIYDLDPSFSGAIRFGALILAQDAQDPEGALRLLERAAAEFPEAWEYPFDQGFILHTVVGDYEGAGKAYRRAAALPGAPELAVRLSGLSFSRLGDRETSREIWLSLLEADNAMTRSLARRSLKNLDLSDGEADLTEAVHAFHDARGRIPSNWEELIQFGGIPALPPDPWGGQFFFVPENNEVLSSTTIDRRMVAVCGLVQGVLDAYEARHGAAPDSLNLLTEEGWMTKPWSPFGLHLDYDNGRGRVVWNPPWAVTEPTTAGEGGEA